MKPWHIAAALLGLGLLAQRVAPAQSDYTIRPIFKTGDVFGDLAIPKDYEFWASGFSDQGHVIIAGFSPGAKEGWTVHQYADGTVTTIARARGASPNGRWPRDFAAVWWSSDLRGRSFFNAFGNDTWLGTYRWDAESGTLTQVLKQNMPAGDWGKIVNGNSGYRDINSRDEMAVVLGVRDASGKEGHGIFLISQDGRWQAVLLRGQELPGGGKVLDERLRPLGVSDSGAVAFLARRQGEKQWSAFLWEQGVLTTLLPVGADAPGGGTFSSINAVRVNNVAGEVIVAATVGNSRRTGIYRVAGGQVIPVAVPGQQMPGGGTFHSIAYTEEAWGPGWPLMTDGIGRPNAKGQFAFLSLTSGNPALYVSEPDGRLSLVLKQGQQTELGKITRLEGVRPILNNQGQIAPTLKIDNGPKMIAILTPAAPQ